MRRALLVGALIFAAGCDPGWSYHISHPRLGVADSSRDQGEIGLLFRGGLSTGMLSVDIELTNGASAPLMIHEDAFRVLDAGGHSLPWYWGRPPTQPCENVARALVRLDRAEVCIMRGNFQVRPNGGIFGGRNTSLKTLTIVIDGLARNGVPIVRSASLEWD